jgi:ElaB/YqjD/DUF883 family membrane-anchored ribosome-binding protein
MAMTTPNTQQLMDDLRAVVADAEALMQATAHDLTDRAKAARERAASSVTQARMRLSEIEETLETRVQAVADDTHQYVRSHPWQSIGVAAAVGVVVGLLMGRRGS